MVINMKLIGIVALCLAPLSVGAQSNGAPNDPTKPPTAYLSPTEAPVAPVSRLTSVMLPNQGGRPSAVIDGQVLRVGERLGEARLSQVTETSATLIGPEGRETLYLIPDVKKTHVVRQPVARSSAKEKR